MPPRAERTIESHSPEARRQRALARAGYATGAVSGEGPSWLSEEELAIARSGGVVGQIKERVGPGTRAWLVTKRALAGTYKDGMMYAGNLAYLSMVAIFPFFIIGAALFELIGGRDDAASMISAVLVSMPPTVRDAIEPVANQVIYSREGWLLWLGAGVALWTVSSLIETIREILRRAYGTSASHAFWKYRLLSAGLILGAVVLLMVSLFAQVLIGTAQQVIMTMIPQLSEAIGILRLSRILPALGLGLSLYMLFYTLTPAPYRGKDSPVWPGALFTASWWLCVTIALPPVLGSFFSYDLTYGSMAGIIVALFFFWLVGLGLVMGAQLNAALVEPETAIAAEAAVAGGLVEAGGPVETPGGSPDGKV